MRPSRPPIPNSLGVRRWSGSTGKKRHDIPSESLEGAANQSDQSR